MTWLHDSIEVAIDGERYLCVRGSSPREPDGYERVARPEQRRLLAMLAATGDTSGLFRVAEIAMIPVPWSGNSVDTESFLQGLRDDIDRELEGFTLFRERRIANVGVAAVESAPIELSDLLPPEAAREDTWHWLEVEIVDPDDAPVPGLQVRVELADGQVRTLVTDDRGLLRIDQIRSADECTISFPALHGGTIEPL